MKLFFLVLACFIAAAAFRRKGALYNFDSKATVPLRGLLAIGIILHHLSLTYQFNECINAFRISPVFYFREMGGPIVAIFFLITGYGLSKSLQTKGTSYLSGFLKKDWEKSCPNSCFLQCWLCCSPTLPARSLYRRRHIKWLQAIHRYCSHGLCMP